MWLFRSKPAHAEPAGESSPSARTDAFAATSSGEAAVAHSDDRASERGEDDSEESEEPLTKRLKGRA